MRFTRSHRPQKGNCFVVMPFGEKQLRDGKTFHWDSHYKVVIEPTIESVGMTPVRADEIYGAQSLMDRVWRGIQEAEVVVADLTGRSPNVLYEVGLAHVIGKRLLILTMYADDVPVDLAEFVQIRYSIEGMQLVQFTRELAKHLVAARAEPATEAMLSPLPGGGVERVPASVISVAPEFATVQAQDGRMGFLNAEDYSWTRRRVDLTKLLRIGQTLDGAFVVDVKGQPRYSLAATEENPWPKVEKEFPIGSPFKATVSARRTGIGAFVPLRYGVDGLIPESQIPKTASLERGAEVETATVRMDPQQREVELRLIRVLSLAKPEEVEGWGPYNMGQQFDAVVVRLVPEKGFALVELPDGFTALMPVARMSSQLRQRLEQQALQEGESVRCEVLAVDDRRRRLTVRDVALE